MPARINLEDDAILTALAEAGGHIAAAASQLGVSYKTLRRRLSADPSLRLSDSINPVWAKALQGNAALRDGTDPSMRGDDLVSRYVNCLAEVGLCEDRREREPKVMTIADTARLALQVAAQREDWEMVDAKARLAQYRDEAWIRRLSAEKVAYLRARTGEFG